jgi:hypothetical protein
MFGDEDIKIWYDGLVNLGACMNDEAAFGRQHTVATVIGDLIETIVVSKELVFVFSVATARGLGFPPIHFNLPILCCQ